MPNIPAHNWISLLRPTWISALIKRRRRRNPDGCQQEDSRPTCLFMYTPAAPRRQKNSFCLYTFTAFVPSVLQRPWNSTHNTYGWQAEAFLPDEFADCIIRLLNGSLLAALANLSRSQGEMPHCSIQKFKNDVSKKYIFSHISHLVALIFFEKRFHDRG